MFLLGGQAPASNNLLKAALLAIVLFSYFFCPTTGLAGLPIFAWSICIGFLLVDLTYLTVARGMSLVDVALSYSGYYLVLLIGPALLTLRDSVPEKVVLRCAIFLFLVCAIIGFAQYLTAQPILYTESADQAFNVDSWNFSGQVRAFSLFTSSMNFGLFCALCGALGVALIRTMPARGALLFVVSALASFCTLTRLSYLVFVCACTCAFVLTFGRKPARTRWHPLLYFIFGIVAILVGLSSLVSGGSGNLQDSSSTIERIIEWGYYSNTLLRSSVGDQLFGLGIVQNAKILPMFPMPIDSVYLALVLHIGLVGLLLFGALLFKMWLYLRSEAVSTQQPFIIAAASLWATLPCAGIFNIVFGAYGAAFALAVLCVKKSKGEPQVS